MFLIFMMFMVAAFDFAIIWSLKVSDESRWPPKIFNFVGTLNSFTIYVYDVPLCFGKLLSSTKVDKLCLGFIQLELDSIPSMTKCQA